MTSDKSQHGGDARRDQKMLETNNLVLQRIAQAAPLAETLSCIVRIAEEQAPEIVGAILLLDEDGDYLRLGAAPSLDPDYRRALDTIALGTGGVQRQVAADIPLPTAIEQIEASRFWQDFRHMALRHGLHAGAAIPILSAGHYLLGIFVAYSRHPEPAEDRHGHRQALLDLLPLAVIAIERSHDQERIQRAEHTLHESETLMALAIEGSGTGIWDRNVASGEIYYSTTWKAMLGYAESEVSNRIEDSYTRVHPDDLEFVKATIQAHFDRKTPTYKVEHRIRCKDGSYKWILSRGKVVSRDQHGQPLRMIGTTTDITATRTLSERLQQTVDLITCLTNEVPGLVFQYRLPPNQHGFLTYVSDGIREIYELTPEQATENIGLVHALIHPDDYENYRASLQASGASLTPWHLEYRVVLPRQGLRWRRGDARPQRLEDGSTLWHGFVTDVTDRKHSELELHEFATIDFLTQLPNRRCFMGCMGEILRRNQRLPGARAAVLMCDLDHFKAINDSYGHATGDLVLQHFASILRDGLRKNDTVGRVGGEEFAVVLPDADIHEATIFARRIQARLREAPLRDGERLIPITVSIGIARIHESDAGVEAALTRSDQALYRAKAGGRNRIELNLE